MFLGCCIDIKWLFFYIGKQNEWVGCRGGTQGRGLVVNEVGENCGVLRFKFQQRQKPFLYICRRLWWIELSSICIAFKIKWSGIKWA